MATEKLFASGARVGSTVLATAHVVPVTGKPAVRTLRDLAHQRNAKDPGNPASPREHGEKVLDTSGAFPCHAVGAADDLHGFSEGAGADPGKPRLHAGLLRGHDLELP